jgi:hypothetical protein
MNYRDLSDAIDIKCDDETNKKFEKVKKIIYYTYLIRKNASEFRENYRPILKNTSHLLETIYEKNGKKKEVLHNFFKVAYVFSDIAEAEDSHRVETVLESAAMPVSSYVLKRKTSVMVNINGYLGGSFSVPPDERDGRWNKSLGFYAPVGIESTWDTLYFFDPPFHSGVFLSVINLGYYFNYKYYEKKENVSEDVKLADTFTPGIFYIMHCPNYPLTAGLGGHYANNYYSGDFKRQWQFAFFVAVDIPLFNFYNR